MNKLSKYFLKHTNGKNEYKNILSKESEKMGGSIIYRGSGLDLDTEAPPVAPIQVKTGESYSIPTTESYSLPTGKAGRRKNKFDF